MTEFDPTAGWNRWLRLADGTRVRAAILSEGATPQLMPVLAQPPVFLIVEASQVSAQAPMVLRVELCRGEHIRDVWEPTFAATDWQVREVTWGTSAAVSARLRVSVRHGRRLLLTWTLLHAGTPADAQGRLTDERARPSSDATALAYCQALRDLLQQPEKNGDRHA